MAAPGRRLICATWPSTQTQPSRAIQAPTFWLTTRTGHGSSDVLRSTSPALTPPTLRPGADRPGEGASGARTMVG
ncbi:hypothetical protein GCM10027186_15980 [Micromonospora schwarzwaldensis]